MFKRDVLESVKTAALARGVRLDEHVVGGLGGIEELTIHEYATTGGITLELPEDVLVNAPFDQAYCASSSVELVLEDDGELWLRQNGSRIPVVRVLPLPGYLDERDAEGRLVSETTMSHADRIRVSPIDGCAYNCSFCNLASEKFRRRPVDQVIAGIDVALADTALPPRHLLISGGSPPIAHAASTAYFDEVCLGVAQHLRDRVNPDGTPFEVDIMMSARPDGPEFVDRLVDAGVTGFSLNVEVYGETYAREHLPLKHKLARPHLEGMIRHAVERLGAGNARVRSLIIPGLEPLESTLEGVDWLASLGCSPVLSPFRPAPDTTLQEAEPVSEELLHEALVRAREIAARHGVPLGPRCVACQHNTLSFPWDVESVV